MQKRTSNHGPGLVTGTAMGAGLLAAMLCGCDSSGSLFGSLTGQSVLGGADSSRSAGAGFLGLGRRPDPLNLTDEQRTQADDIFGRAREDVRALREAAHAEILEILTDEQEAALEEFRAKHAPPFGPHGARGPGGFGFGPPPFAHGPGGPDGDRAGFFEKFADELGLTDEQRTQIEPIHENLHTAVKARHDLAREEFRAILTEEQRATLDEIKASLPERP